MNVETWPRRTVYVDVWRDGDDRRGYACFEDHSGAWTVCEVHDIRTTRHMAPLAADFPTRASAEAHIAALLHAETGAAA